MAHHPAAAAAFAELGRIRLGETDLDGVLHRVADLAGRTIPGAAHVSITLLRERGVATVARTGETAERLDDLQYERGDGPCLEASRDASTVLVPDTTADRRWDGWGPEAAAAGAGSALSLGLPIRDGLRGALNLYGTAPRAFDTDAVALAETFARYATIALANAHLYDTTADLARHMQAAMESRAVIEQAKGIIMGERRCGPDEAFALLTKASQDSNRKLRDVAAALVERTRRG